MVIIMLHNIIILLLFFTDKSLNNIAIDVCNSIRLVNPDHPLFEHENCLKRVVERGKFNLDHDLFDETSTMFILDNIRQTIFSGNQRVCYCNHDLNCFLLQQVYILISMISLFIVN